MTLTPRAIECAACITALPLSRFSQRSSPRAVALTKPAATAKSVAHHDAEPIRRGPDGLPIDEHDMDSRVEGWKTLHRYVLRANERCLSGAMDLYVPPTEVRWARALRFRMHSPRALTFHVDVRRTPRAREWLGSTMWGEGADKHAEVMREQTACVSQTVSVASPTDSTGTATKPVTASPKTTTATTPASHARTAVTSAPPPAPVDISVSPESPMSGFVDLGLVDYNALADRHRFDIEWVIESRFAQIPMNDVHRNWVVHDSNNEPLYVRVWTQEPQDLDGVIIEIQDRVLEPHIPDAEYARLLERRVGAGKQRQDEFMALCHEHPEDERCYFTDQNRRKWVAANQPPPPPREEKQPAQPSADHVWIGGGWQWNGTDYVWIGGMWRYVPPPVVATAAGSTQTRAIDVKPPPVAPQATATATANVVAPAQAVIMPNAAPTAPPPRTEAIPPAPQAGAMWIAGYWTWSETTWTWITGRWQMPPEGNARWTPPMVQIHPGGMQVFMPGGWIRLGR